ncbi:hypothetical protein [Streptomyces sp. NPDC048256]|uniref:hypothetical protein n=1 Tax=unclassified Streptomyces TaxID=2593676 RepID=UPI0033FBDC05
MRHYRRPYRFRPKRLESEEKTEANTLTEGDKTAGSNLGKPPVEQSAALQLTFHSFQLRAADEPFSLEWA